MNKPVNFEIAKLLKEKKCDLNHEYMAFTSVETEKYLEGELFLKPTITEVIMWLYEKHGIWITSEPYVKQEWETVTFIYKIFRNGYVDTISRAYLGFNSPTEAYEVAIEYTLNNLI